jgi:CRP-like cAMP-binding protein
VSKFSQPVKVTGGKMAKRIEKSFCKGEVIIKEGHSGSTFYVILEGLVEVLKHKGDKEVVVNVLGPNEFFGEMSLIDPGRIKRSATVRALEDTRVAIMTRKDLEKYLGNLSPGVRNLLIKLASRLEKATERAEAPKTETESLGSPTFDYTMTLDELEKARAHSVDINFINKKFRKGQVILREGESGQCGFIVKTGSLEVSRNTEQGKVVLSILNEHDILGENALFDNVTRSATVTALTDGELMVFGKRDMLSMARQSSVELFMIMDSMSAKLDRVNEAYCNALIEAEKTKSQQGKLQARLNELTESLTKLSRENETLKEALSKIPRPEANPPEQ